LKVGFFGGTFDPPHKGHVALARAALKELKLDRLYVVPAGDPPLKPARPTASAPHRLAMARLAFGRLPKTVVSPWEIRRRGVSYTYLTLASLRRRHPKARWFLVMGGDTWRAFTRWRRWRDILTMAVPAVGLRAGVPRSGISPVVRAASVLLKSPLPDVSSTSFRADRLPSSSLPAGVASFIRVRRLYGDRRG
jgi:nicotinate-nucleotide adenylyltransferase